MDEICLSCLIGLLTRFRKALDSLAGRESGEPHRLREQAQREMDALHEAFNKRITDLEEVTNSTEQQELYFLFQMLITCHML